MYPTNGKANTGRETGAGFAKPGKGSQPGRSTGGYAVSKKGTAKPMKRK